MSSTAASLWGQSKENITKKNYSDQNVKILKTCAICKVYNRQWHSYTKQMSTRLWVLWNQGLCLIHLCMPNTCHNALQRMLGKYFMTEGAN